MTGSTTNAAAASADTRCAGAAAVSSPINRAGLDVRLLDISRVPDSLAWLVLGEHTRDKSQPACPACGWVPTAEQSQCRSHVVAYALAHHTRLAPWRGNEAPAGPGAPVEQPGLFAAEFSSAGLPAGRRSRPHRGRAA